MLTLEKAGLLYIVEHYFNVRETAPKSGRYYQMYNGSSLANFCSSRCKDVGFRCSVLPYAGVLRQTPLNILDRLLDVEFAYIER